MLCWWKYLFLYFQLQRMSAIKKIIEGSLSLKAVFGRCTNHWINSTKYLHYHAVLLILGSERIHMTRPLNHPKKNLNVSIIIFHSIFTANANMLKILVSVSVRVLLLAVIIFYYWRITYTRKNEIKKCEGQTRHF